MINLEFQSARTLWLIVLPIAALAVVWWTYRRTYPPVGGCYRWLLLLLRSAAVVLLGLLIFEPLLGLSRERTRPARVAVLIDRSASMLLPADAAKGGAGEDPSGKSRLERAREILETQERGSRVDLFSFGSR
ncbi:MAG: hypothetical protein U9N45_01390, partial [Gemmatimonadota bacterium]|nr:hypothetical protein [Gemmatimonadota bacterium]